MKIAFVDNLFHKKTGSSIFFTEILKTKNEVTYIWHNSWINDDFLNINEINNGNYDLIIFWQVIAKPRQIKNIACKNIIWIPMYDTEVLRLFYKLQTIGYLNFGVRVISFSQTLSTKLEKINFDILTVKYYPEPNFVNKNTENINIIFWQRIKNINWELIKNILSGNKIQKIYFKNNPDPQYKEIKDPPLEDLEKYNIEIINGWVEFDKYIDILKKCDIYIAPRKYEGIGMGFLDAMATGTVVISPDSPTANEYIKNGYNGYLYDIKNPKQIDLSNIKEINKNLEKNFTEGYEKWKKQEQDILEFIKTKNSNIKIKHKLLYIIFCLYSPILETLRKIKRLLKIKFY